VDIYNQSSDLFVRSDGTIELPAVQVAGTWQYAPIVAQTWDGSQRYALLNQTKSQVPSTYDDYPGYEYYLPGNVYLPGQAGVVTGYLNYQVWDSTGQLDYRQTDLWLGFKGDSVDDVSTWAYAPVAGTLTEPGGQGNKPYMMGAGNNASGQYLFRLQASNSFGVARLLSTDLQGKLYDASFYANFNDGKGYQKAATISCQWQPWTLSGTTQATWITSPDSYGAGVAQLTYANKLAGQVAITADQSSWNSGARVLPWETVSQVDPSQLSTYASTLNNAIWGNYTIVGTGMNATTQFLIVLNPMAYFTPSAGGDWGTAANWSSGAVPDDNHNVYLLQGGTVTYNNTSLTAPPLSMLQVDGGTILQINTASPTGDLKAEMAIVGAANTGTLVQTNGTVTLTDKLYLGYETTSNGTYNLQGGTFTAAGAQVGVYGTGTFTQSAGTATISDTLTLAANSGSTGTYNLSGGTLNVGTLTQNAGGTFNKTGGTVNYTQMNLQGGNFVGDLDNRTLLTGYGTITGKLTNSGTVNPGLSTLTVGTYTVNPGATHVVEISSASSYGKVVATGAGAGAVTLNGGTLSPRLLGGYLPSTNQVFTIIQNTGAGGTVVGAFSSIDNPRVGNSRTLFWQLLYNSVDLKAVGNYTPDGLSLSRNQRSVGNMLNDLAPTTTSGDMLTVLDAINVLTDDQAVASSFDEISPQKYAALPTLAFPVTHMQFQYLQNRLARQRWEAQLGSDAVSSGGGGFMRGFNFGYDNTKMLLASSTFTVSDAGTPLIRSGAEHRWGIYLEPMANWGNLRPTTNTVGYHYKNFGFTLGADYWVMENWLVGVNTGYSKTLTGVGGTGGDINANVIPFNAYTAFFLKGFYVNGTLGYTFSNYDMERNVSFSTINRTAKANTSGNQFQVAAETGYDIKVGKAIVGPTVSLQYATQTTAGFTESNAGALSLRVDSQTADSLQTGIGARASYRAKVGNVTVKPQLAVVWQHEFSNNTRGVNARLAQGSSTMNFRTDKIGQNFAVVSFDLPARVTKNLMANVGYTAEVGRSKSSNQGVNLGLRYEF
jgi:outer membrane lipase/esterase